MFVRTRVVLFRSSIVAAGKVELPAWFAITSSWYESKMEFLHKLTWLVLGGDPAARSHGVEQFTAL